MLAELTIRDFAIIDELHLTLGPAFNVLTGETGAGKSIIVDAVSLLMGGWATREVIRSGADRALIEGIFYLEPKLQAEVNPLLASDGLEGDDPSTLSLAREIQRKKRNICRINGRAVTLSALEAVGRRLVDIHGQSGHLSLLRAREHIDFLDRYGGLWPQRRKLAAKVEALRQVREELTNLRRDERELARRVDLLEYQVQEINAAGLVMGEEEELRAERTRLANAERLLTLAETAYQSLSSSTVRQDTAEEGRPGAYDLLGETIKSLSQLVEIDPSLNEVLQAAEELSYRLEDIITTVRDYRESVEYNPRRLTQVEERLSLVQGLKRKYGDSIEEILAFGQRAEEELDSIAHSEERIEELRAQEEKLLREIGELGAVLSEARRQAADGLKAKVERELAGLSMGDARFDVSIEQREDAEGAWAPAPFRATGQRLAFDRTGIDHVEFLISPNVGEPLKPLASVASGGETSRLMLALKTVLSMADETPTLIFDEIDAGIGGRVGEVVGYKLWSLTPEHQVLCVTHLPQLAAYGDAHFRVAKSVVGRRTVAGVEPLDAEERITELAVMLGADRPETRHSAEAMLAEIEREKGERGEKATRR
ncbi:MAG: DNA repair protein RecN [Chloroflexota bacterium]|nr:DNA repair protein RecN [Chloroflexota bacterium]